MDRRQRDHLQRQMDDYEAGFSDAVKAQPEYLYLLYPDYFDKKPSPAKQGPATQHVSGVDPTAQ